MSLLPAAPLNLYLTWSLGQDFGGFAVIYAISTSEAYTLLDHYCQHAQPRHQLFPQYLQERLLHYRPDCVSSRHPDAYGKGQHIYHVGLAPADETRPRVLLVDEGEDLRFND